MWSISFAKKFEVLEEVSALKFFLSSLYSYWIIFQISSSQSDLCSNCNERSPEVYQLRSSQQEKLWFQTWSNKVCFRPFKNKEKIGQVFNVWRTFEEFSGLDLQTRYIINVLPLVLCQRLLDKCPNFCHFLILLYNFVFNVNWLANILLEPLLIYGFNNFQYFQPFLGSLWSFPAWTCHNPSNIHFSLLNPIKLPLKFIKSFWNTFWIMFKGSVWFLHCLKKSIFG